MPARANLFNRFKPAAYQLATTEDGFIVIIDGQKLGPPSHRLVLHQNGLKISGAKLIRFDKTGPVSIEIDRINHLPSFEQVRLHSDTVMFPGRYKIELEYKISKDKPAELRWDMQPDRTTVPSIDEPAAWTSAKFEFKP